MTVYEVPNIEHCTVTPMANGNMIKIKTNDGWVIHLPEYADNQYSTVIILAATDDFSIVEILPISSIEGKYEITDKTTQPEIA